MRVNESRERFQRSWAFAVVLFGAMALTACSDDKDGGETPNPPGPELECERAADCGTTEYCDAGECVPAPSCSGAASWSQCANKVDGAFRGDGNLYACINNQCTRQCETDLDCAGDSTICSDFGQCIEFTGTVEEFVPTEGTASAVRVGFGEELMKYPIGLSLGGYGSRSKADDGPYASGISASQGQIGAQFVRSIWLENEENTLILVRAPIIFPTGYIHERVARELQAELGRDLRDELIMVGTHTHSGPGRHWRLPAEALLDLGMLGTGAFFQKAEDWMVESMTASILKAHESLAPGRVGWKIVEAYDVEDTVARDRWSSTPHFDMNRLLLIRVDREDGKPLAAIMSYATHATDNSSDYATDDVVGGAEIGLSAALSREFGYYIPTLYMPEGGGSMSHATGTQGHRFPHSIERAGGVMISKALSEFLDISTSEEIGFRSRTYRFPLTYGLMGYEEGEFGSPGTRPLKGIYHFGGLLCGGDDADDNDYATSIPPRRLACVSLALMLHNRAPTLLMRAAITAIEFDGLSIVTLPGEATQEITWQALQVLRDEFSRPSAQSWVFSYAQSHLLYLTPSNLRGAGPDVPGYEGAAPDTYPDLAYSFLQGGYEPGMSPWGHRSGDFLIARVKDAFGWLVNGTEPAVAPILPEQHTHIAQPEVPVESTPAARVGAIVTQVPASVSYFELGSFEWVGGDTGAEMPQAPLVTLLKVNGGDATPVRLADHRDYTNREPLMATRVRKNEAGEFVWTAYFDFRPDEIDPGFYRFQVEGHVKNEAGEIVPYTTTTQDFQVDRLVVNITTELEPEHSIELPIFLAEVARLQMDVDGERAKLGGNLRPGNWLTPPGVETSFECGGNGTAVCEGFTESGFTVALETQYENHGGQSGVPITNLSIENRNTEFQSMSRSIDLLPGLRIELVVNPD